MKTVQIWDGLQYNWVSPEEAQKLISEDKAQSCEGGLLAQHHKFRGEFTGYNKKAAPEPSSSDLTPLQRYNLNRKAAAKHFGKTYREITRDDVEAYKRLTDEAS